MSTHQRSLVFLSHSLSSPHLIFNGVTVSIHPLNAENPTVLNKLGIKASALIFKYGLAYFRAGEFAGKTLLSAKSECPRRKYVPRTPRMPPRIRAWQIVS